MVPSTTHRDRKSPICCVSTGYKAVQQQKQVLGKEAMTKKSVEALYG